MSNIKSTLPPQLEGITASHWLVTNDEGRHAGIVRVLPKETFSVRLTQLLNEHYDNAEDIICHEMVSVGDMQQELPVVITTDPEDDENGSYEERLTLSPVWEY